MKRNIGLLVVLTLIITSVLAFTASYDNGVTAAPMFQKVNFVNGTVTANALNVRQGPATSYPVVCKLNKGASVKVFGKIGDWYAVYENGGGCVGAVLSQYIKVQGTVTPVKTPAKAPAKAPTKAPTKAPAKAPSQATKAPSQPAPNATQPPAAPSLDNVSSEEQEVLNLVNKARADAGVGPLQFDPTLQKVARLKAKDMVDHNYFSHQSPTYGSPFDMMRQFGVSFKSAGENIAGNQTAKGAFDAWMKSEGHRKNILNGNFDHTGIGIVSGSSYGKIYVQQFIKK